MNDLEAQARDALRQTDLSPAFFDLLLHLSDQDGGKARIVKLSNVLGITTGGATRLVDRAMKLGLVTRLPAPEDKRGSYVAITQSGRVQFELALPLMLDSFIAGGNS